MDVGGAREEREVHPVRRVRGRVGEECPAPGRDRLSGQPTSPSPAPTGAQLEGTASSVACRSRMASASLHLPRRIRPSAATVSVRPPRLRSRPARWSSATASSATLMASCVLPALNSTTPYRNAQKPREWAVGAARYASLHSSTPASGSPRWFRTEPWTCRATTHVSGSVSKLGVSSIALRDSRSADSNRPAMNSAWPRPANTQAASGPSSPVSSDAACSNSVWLSSRRPDAHR